MLLVIARLPGWSRVFSQDDRRGWVFPVAGRRHVDWATLAWAVPCVACVDPLVFGPHGGMRFSISSKVMNVYSI